MLSVMENIDRVMEDDELKQFVKERGLGTPATRAGIIEKLIQVGYIERKVSNSLVQAWEENLSSCAGSCEGY